MTKLKQIFFILWISIIFVGLVGCTSSNVEPRKLNNKNDKQIVFASIYENYFKSKHPYTQVVDKKEFDLNQDNQKELIIAYIDREKNTRSNIAIVSPTEGTALIDLAHNDLNYHFIEPPFLEARKPNVIIVPLMNEKTGEIIEFEIEVSKNLKKKMTNFKISSKLKQ